MKHPVLFAFIFLSAITFGQQSDFFNQPKTKATYNAKISADYGLALRVGKIDPNAPSGYKAHLKQLKNGTNFNINLSVPINNKWGLGFYYTKSNANNSCNCTFPIAGDTAIFVSESWGLSSFGATYKSIFATRDNKLLVDFDAGLMYTKYRGGFYATNSRNGYLQANITGAAVSVLLAMGCDIKIINNIYAGVSMRLISGSISNINNGSQTIKLEKPEDISHFDLNAGLRILF